MKKRVIAIVQARMQSTRLPGKVLMTVIGKSLLGFLIERMRKSRSIDDIVIATSVEVTDDVIAEYCATFNIKCFRGSEEDVLSRYFEAAADHRADFVIRVCSDSPLIDPLLIDQLVNEYLNTYPKYDYYSNTLDQSCPLGMNVEIFSFESLMQANVNANQMYEREHVTPYIYRNPEIYKIGRKNYQPDLSSIRLTVDTPEDFELIKSIIEKLYPINPAFSLADIIALVEREPDLLKINSHISQKKLVD
jgi:spore coat polysaccharide biosynthesis protein SpsF